MRCGYTVLDLPLACDHRWWYNRQRDLRLGPASGGQMKARIILVSVLALMAGGHLLYGQGTARIVGVVSDPGGGLVPNAQVILINDATGLREAAPTDAGGRYNFTQLAVGNYRIEVSAAG